MKDPARIPLVLAELQQTWEAQPDLSLPTLFGLLANRGVGWGSGDEELIDALTTLRREHPAQLAGHSRTTAPPTGEEVPGRFLVETEAPAHRVTVDPFRVSVRRVTREQRQPQPGVWEFQRIRRCRAGDPLVITDAAGIDHRLGVVARITLLNPAPTAEVAGLDGLRRREIGERVFQLVFEGGDTALLSHGLEIYRVSRRSIEHRRLKWDQLLHATPGQPLQVRPADGGAVLELGVLARIVVLEE